MPKPHHNRVTTPDQDEKMTELIKTNPKITAIQLKRDVNLKASMRTIRKRKKKIQQQLGKK